MALPVSDVMTHWLTHIATCLNRTCHTTVATSLWAYWEKAGGVCLLATSHFYRGIRWVSTPSLQALSPLSPWMQRACLSNHSYSVPSPIYSLFRVCMCSKPKNSNLMHRAVVTSDLFDVLNPYDLSASIPCQKQVHNNFICVEWIYSILLSWVSPQKGDSFVRKGESWWLTFSLLAARAAALQIIQDR